MTIFAPAEALQIKKHWLHYHEKILIFYSRNTVFYLVGMRGTGHIQTS